MQADEVRDRTEQSETERRLREQIERLREKEEHYRRIFESTSDGLIINDPRSGVVVEANPAVCRMHGFSYEEFIGLHATQFIHPSFHPVFEDFRRTIEAGGAYQCEALDIRKDGSSFCVEVHGSSVMYQGRPHILAVVRDITERVQARELLEQRVEERTRELFTLLEVSRNVTSTLELQPLLDLILDQLQSIVDYAGAGIVVQEADELRIARQRGPASYMLPPETRIPLDEARPLRDLIIAEQRLIIDDVRGGTMAAQIYRELVGESIEAFPYIRSWMAVPMRVKDHEIGALFLAHNEPNAYDPHHADLALAIARQAAIAIENARLYERAQEVAVLEERQRLSRELHDSVSQALYGIGVGAQTTRILLERDPGQAIESNEYVLNLAEAGLAEMRALIFELRPESLETEGIVAALQKQAEALHARHRIPVETALCDEPAAALKVKEALYRIAQEALQNAVKHASPTRLELRLASVDGVLLLEIRDDGAGFDPNSSFPGHLGLQSMRERAARLGGALDLESDPGSGTRVRASIPY